MMREVWPGLHAGPRLLRKNHGFPGLISSGQAMWRAGGNRKNYALVWMAPVRDFAVAFATNQAGRGATKACE